MYLRRTLIAVILVGVASAHTAALAQEELTGMFRMSHTTAEVVGAQMADDLSEVIPVDEELQWQVYVPETYHRTRPAGVFVFIDPNGWGGIPDQWQQVFQSHNIIWIGPKRRERNVPAIKSIWNAKLAVLALEEQDYSVDLNRLYTGSSGDAAVATINVLLGANEFAGGVYMSGSLYSRDFTAEQLEILGRKHHVFITGTNDRAKTQVRRDYKSYKKAGIQNVKLIFEMGRLGKMPKPEHIDEALRYLDSRLAGR
jgi:hypothetical protein